MPPITVPEIAAPGKYADWKDTPEFHRFRERVAIVFPDPADQQVAIDDLVDNVRYVDRMQPQEMKNMSYSWAHYVDHGFGGSGPGVFTKVDALDAAIPKEAKGSVRELTEREWMYFIVMMRSNAGVEMRCANDGSALYEYKLKAASKAPTSWGRYECVAKQTARFSTKP